MSTFYIAREVRNPGKPHLDDPLGQDRTKIHTGASFDDEASAIAKAEELVSAGGGELSIVKVVAIIRAATTVSRPL